MLYEHYDHCVCYVPTKHCVYVIAGYNKDCEYYDVKENTCTQIAPVNDKEKWSVSCCLLNDKYIYVIGGYDQNNKLERYDIDGN